MMRKVQVIISYNAGLPDGWQDIEDYADELRELLLSRPSMIASTIVDAGGLRVCVAPLRVSSEKELLH